MNPNQLAPLIFLAFANEQDNRVRYLRNLPEEARRLRQTLDQAAQRGLCEIIERPNATLAEILDVFQDARFRNRIAIFHYGGHANGYQLLLESASGATAAADAGGLATFLGRQSSLQLVFLNGCSTQPQVEGLLAAGVPAVIATAQAIDDAVATEFAARFYHGLANGVALQPAFDQAAAALQSAHGSQNPRGLYWDKADQPADRWPWDFYLKAGAKTVADWNLPQAAGDYLFGLPELPPLDLPPSPFRHLYWFEREHAPLFFGREQPIRELYQRIISPETAPLILLYGQSGVGKSSLLAAGLLPRLESEYAIRYQRRDPIQGLWGSLSTALQLEDGATSFGQRWRELEQITGRPLTIILDQVEEVFTRPLAGPDEFKAFLATLSDIFAAREQRPQGKLILGFRKEWLAEIEQQLIEQRLPLAKIFLERLDFDDIVRVVSGPVQMLPLQVQYGLSIDDDLPNLIAGDLLADPESPIAPTLQILLTKLWTEATRENPDHPHFSVELYQRLKKEGILLADFLNQQLDQLRTWRSEVETSGLALDVLAYHTTSLGTATQHSRQELAESYAHQADVLPQLVQQCQDLYLLVDLSKNRPDQVGASQLAHDTLAPLVRRQFDESDRPGQRARRILESRAVEWDGGQIGTPLDESDLALVEQGRVGMRTWTGTEERLIQASRKERDKRERNRVFRWVFSIFAISLLVVAAIVAEQRRQDAEAARSDANAAAATAEARRQEALAQQLATQSELLRGRPASLPQSILLAAESLRIFPSLTGDQTLRKSLDQSPLLFREFSHYLVRFVAFSPDGQLVAAASTTGASVWEISSGREVAKLAPDHEVLSVAFSSDGQQLITCTLKVGIAGGSVYCGEVQTWEIHSGREITHSSYEVQLATSFALSPDGQILAIASTNTDVSDSKVQVWEIQSGREIARLSHDQYVSSIAFSPNGNWLATGTVDTEKKSAVRIWEVSSGQKVDELLIGQPIHSVTFSPNGQWLAINRTGDALDIWEIGSRRNVVQLLHGVDPLIESVAFSPDSQWLATLSYTNSRTVSEMRVWEVNTGQEVSLLPMDDKIATYVAFSPNGDRIAIGSTTGVSIWEFNPYQAIVRLPSGNQFVLSLAFSPDSQSLAIGGAKAKGEIGKPQIWDISSGREVSHLPQDRQVGTSVAFNSNGSWLAVGGADKTLVWDIKSGKEVTKLLHPDQGVLSVAFSQDNRWLVTGSMKKDGSFGEVRIWEISSGRELIRLPHNDQVVTSVALSPEGHWLATVSNKNDNLTGEVRIWEISSGREVMQLPHNDQMVWSVAFSPDGQFLATSSTDAARIWEVNSGREIVQLPHNDQVVWSAAFSPDGKWLATGASDANKSSGEVRVWEISSHRIVAQMPHGKFLTVVAFSPDGHWLATGSSNSDGTFGETRVWLWRPKDLITAACQHLNRNLSWAEWQQYLDQEPYHKTCPDLPKGEGVPSDTPQAP